MVSSEYFIHPHDAQALDALKSIPGFAMLSKKYSEIFSERWWKLSNLSSRLKLSKQQLPEIYEILPPICDKLEIPVPELYLEENPYINACAGGDTTPFIRINSGLINNCTPDIIKTVLAHECGHIVCHHSTYKAMASFFLGVGSSLINIPFLTFALKYALLYWDRCSEYSADRVAAFVCGGAEPVVKMMSGLVCGSPTLLEKIDTELFLKQADEFYSYSEESLYNAYLMFYDLIHQDHPFVADRAADIVKWCDSKDYEDLCNGVPYTPPKPNNTLHCPKCSAPIDNETSFCSSCGTKIVHCPNCGAVFTEEDTFCDKCGSNLS